MIALLELDRVSAGYGAAPVLADVSLAVPPGGAVALLGRNGMGKTTTVRAIAGQTPWRTGRIRLDGQETANLPLHRLARLGVAVVPEGRRIFPTLTVRENLTAFAPRRTQGPRWTPARVWALFPELAARADSPGAHLSGGEQQMLAIGRALMTGPRLLILDEATEGLAPPLRARVWALLADLRAGGVGLVVIDQSLPDIRRLCPDALILMRGNVAWHGPSAGLDAATADRLLGLPEVSWSNF